MTMKKIRLDEIRTGDIILTSGTSLLSEAIQEFQEIDNEKFGIYSHAAVAWRPHNHLFVVEAQAEGIVPSDFVKKYMNDNYKSLMVLRPKLNVNDNWVGNFMIPYLQGSKTRYNFENTFLLQPIKIVFNKWIGSDKSKGNKFECAQWAAFVMNNTVGHLTVNEPKTAPVDLAINTAFFHRFILK